MPAIRTNMVAIEIDARRNSDGAIITFYVSNATYRTKATDTPAHRQFLPFVERLPNYARFMHGPGRTSGPGYSGVGDLQISSTGRLDDWKTAYTFSGQAIRIYILADNFAAYSQKRTWLLGTQRTPIFTRQGITIRFRDYDRDLDRPISQNTYGGTGDADGHSDIAGISKPLTFGVQHHAPGVLVNPSRLIWQVHDGIFEQVMATYDGGNLAYSSAGTDYPTFTALQSASLASTQMATCKTLGYIRLGATPIYRPTFDLKGSFTASAGASTTAEVAQRMLVAHGPLAAGDIATGVVSAMNAKDAYPVGYYVPAGQPITVREAVDAVLEGAGMHRNWRRTDGKIEFGRLEPPTGTVVKTLSRVDFTRDWQLRPSSDQNEGVPPWRIDIIYRQLGNRFGDGDIAGAVSQQDRVVLTRGYSMAQAISTTLVSAYPDSVPMIRKAFYASASGAIAESTRQKALRSTPRDFWDVFYATLKHTDAEIGQEWALQESRFDLTAGKPLMVVGIDEDLHGKESQAQLWG